MIINKRKVNKYKWCWLSTETKQGWRLKLSAGSKNYNLVGAVFSSIEEVEKVINGTDGKIVFIHLKNNNK